MATVVSSPNPHGLFRMETDAINTIPDPRTPSPSSSAATRQGSTDSGHHPDLSNEVAALSTKLINAYNHSTTLDDALQAARHELDKARQRIRGLEDEKAKHEEAIKSGALVARDAYDAMQRGLRQELADEKVQRAVVEKDKRRIENELENLTTALFEEANTMVAAARKEQEATEKKNEQLKNQLHDTEVLLASHQEQLQDLKAVMQQMSSERHEDENNTHASPTPSTPGVTPQDKMNRILEATNLSPVTPQMESIPPDHPLKFTHLISPVLRTDITAYDDFRDLLKVSKSSQPPSRVPSGSYGGLNVLGLASSLTPSGQTANSVTSVAVPRSPSIQSSSGNNSPRDATFLPSLKDNKFYKRALAEDIEPTLRLDIAPGLSWMARRTVINSMTVGSLVVEPHPPISKFYGPVFSCSLCGESRKGEIYRRKHRFRTSESDDAQRYPLCDYCLGRVRTTCDYIGFLRMCKDGHWRAGTEEELKSAWEESVRLREKMFWSRLGGGVTPAFIMTRDTPKSPAASPAKINESRGGETPGVLPEGMSQSTFTPEDPFRSETQAKHVSIGKTVIMAPETQKESEAQAMQREENTSVSAEEIDRRATQQLHDDEQNHVPGQQSNTGKEPDIADPVSNPQSKDEEKRLSLTIPGSFA